mgnify:CR=1 FL=1
MFEFKKSEGTSQLDRLQRASPTVFTVYLVISFIVLIFFQNINIWPSGVELFIWAFVKFLYLAVCDAIYVLLMICNLVRRRPIYRPVWVAAVFMALLTISAIRFMNMSVMQCGGWEEFTAALEAPFQEGWSPIDRYLTELPG